jgi:hypothetical protein
VCVEDVGIGERVKKEKEEEEEEEEGHWLKRDEEGYQPHSET